MWLIFLRKKIRLISLLSAGLCGFGIAINNLMLGAISLILALVLDLLSCYLEKEGDLHR